MISYHYNKEEKTVIFSKPIKKGKDNIKIYFYRNIDERDTYDYPVATTNANGTNKFDWLSGFDIMGINIKQPKLFGLLGNKWEVVTEELNNK